MYRTIISLALSSALFACSQANNDPQLASDGYCEEPRPEICTMEYAPVCAVVDGEKKEYGNACSACGDPQVESFQNGNCL